ncbi:hypothetical protein EVAR_89235_1 [Eumeta japonica]|uniref:Uncharacterized protein n=1 Tax=Eumeta variegata TaxID=151549 RepID=A0A4C1VK90_EUMVA|nr:hypothetical protein EVAR_89235_1 [Eumeta japonica]
MKITVPSVHDYRTFIRLLINDKIPFHTHSLDEERKIKACVAYRASLWSLSTKREDPDSAIGAKTMSLQPLTAMPNPDV